MNPLHPLSSMNRRDMIKLSAGAMLAAGVWPGQLRAAENGKGESDWSFIAVNDLHYDTKECGPWFQKVVTAMKASAPTAEFCLLGGDLSDGGHAAQLGPVRDIFSTLQIPIYATPGNHEILIDGSRAGYDDLFPGQLNQVFEHRGWQVVSVDSTDGFLFRGSAIQHSTFLWLDTQLPKLDPTKPTILWTHFPLGVDVMYRPTNADLLLERFQPFNIRAAFSGHWHGLSEKPWQKAILTTDRCCSRVKGNHDGSKEKGWFVCTVKDGEVSRQFVQIPEELRTHA